MIKKISLYLLAIGLLLFASRKQVEESMTKLLAAKPKDPNKDIEKQFEVQKLQWDSTKQQLVNNALYFQTIHLLEGEIKAGAATKKTRQTVVEADKAEEATASE